MQDSESSSDEEYNARKTEYFKKFRENLRAVLADDAESLVESIIVNQPQSPEKEENKSEDSEREILVEEEIKKVDIDGVENFEIEIDENPVVEEEKMGE